MSSDDHTVHFNEDFAGAKMDSSHFNDVNRSETIPVGIQRAITNRLSDKAWSCVGNTHDDDTDLTCSDGGGVILNVKSGSCYLNGVRAILESNSTKSLSAGNGYYVMYFDLPSALLTNDLEPPFNITMSDLTWSHNAGSYVEPSESIDRMIIAYVIVDTGAITSVIDKRPSYKKIFEQYDLPIGIVLMYEGAGIDYASSRTEQIGDLAGDTIVMPGWYVCNGNAGDDGTPPDLIDHFVKMETTAGNIDGEDNVTLDPDQMGAHNHVYEHRGGPMNCASGGDQTWYYWSSAYTSYTGTGGSHNNIPPYYKLIFIKKMR